MGNNNPPNPTIQQLVGIEQHAEQILANSNDLENLSQARILAILAFYRRIGYNAVPQDHLEAVYNLLE